VARPALSPGLQIDHQLELRGSCDREVGRPVAFENAADVGSGLRFPLGDFGKGRVEIALVARLENVELQSINGPAAHHRVH
jgi:hypothetical protein